MHQWRRAKGAFIGFGIAILIAACMLGSALTLLFTVPARYDALANELDAADVNIVIPKVAAGNGVRQQIADVDGVSSVEEQNVILTDSTIKDFRGTDFTIRTMIIDDGTPRALNRTKTTATDLGHEGGHDIAIPKYAEQFGEFAPGGTISMRMDGEDATFRICAVDEEMEFGNAGSGILLFGAPPETFDDLERRLPDARMTQYALRTAPGADPAQVRSTIERELASDGVPLAAAIDRDTVRSTRTMVSQLIILVLVVFAGAVAIVSLALCTFHTKNIVEQERVDMGVLKALGYTGSMISRAMMAPYTVVCAAASLLGLALSFALTSMLGSLVSMQSGFTYEPTADIRAFGITLIVLVAVTLLFAWMGVRSVRTLQPIDAIRGCGQSARRAMLALQDTPGNAPTAITLQQVGTSASRNMLVGAIAMLMTLLISFSATLVHNSAVKPDNLYNTLSGETPQITVISDAAHTGEVRHRIEAIPDVDDVINYTTERISIDGTRMPAYVSDDFTAASNDIHYEGEHPSTDGQIAIGSALAADHPIDSIITVTLGDVSRSYEIVGYIQSVNDGGNACELTESGYQRLDPTFADGRRTLYVYCDGPSSERIIRAIKEECVDLNVHVNDMERMRTTSQEMYGTLMSSVSLAIFVIALILASLVLMMVIRSSIVRERRRFGILKALGYTSGQLMMQVSATLLPATVMGAAIGMAIALTTMRGTIDTMLSIVGVMRSQFEIPAVLPAAASVILVILQFALALGFARPIRKVSAYALITE